MVTKQSVVRMILCDVGEASVHESAVSEEPEEGAVSGSLTPVSWCPGLMLPHNTCLLPHDGTKQPTISQVKLANNQQHFLTSFLYRHSVIESRVFKGCKKLIKSWR